MKLMMNMIRLLTLLTMVILIPVDLTQTEEGDEII
jgi:hypothetical protein